MFSGVSVIILIFLDNVLIHLIPSYEAAQVACWVLDTASYWGGAATLFSQDN